MEVFIHKYQSSNGPLKSAIIEEYNSNYFSDKQASYVFICSMGQKPEA